MNLPNHYPLQFPHDDHQYLEALAQDYLELMGEEPTVSPHNNLLIEYDTPSIVPDRNGERNGEGQ